VAYADIPLPFGEMHTENLEASQLIRAAVVAQLAKPAVKPSALTLLTKGFKYELLTWVGIVGGALTLFTNLDAVLKLAGWAHVLVENWKEWTHASWVWAFGWLGIHLPPEWTPVLSFLLFGSLLTIGQAVKFNRTIKKEPLVDKYDSRSFQLKSRRTLFCLGLIIVSLIPALVLFVDYTLLNYTLISMIMHLSGKTQNIIVVGIFIVSVITPPIIIVLFARHRLRAALSVFLIIIFCGIVVIRPLISLDVTYARFPTAVLTAAVITLVLPIILLSIAPAKAISRRLIFLALGLLLLIALNELSKLGLDLTAPKLQG
jgi:hypothetical protein